MNVFSSWKPVLADSGMLSAYETYVRQVETRVNSFLEWRVDNSGASDVADGPLAGIPYAVKDNIAVKGYGLTCGSRMLAHMVSPYSATAVERLQAAGARIVGKTNLDEFGMGSSTDNSALAVSNNPWDETAVCGGSSGGSAAAVAAGMVPFALGSDTGGSVRQPAAFCGCLGLKPTYGTVSRFGLVAYASSLEVVGVLARDVDELASVYSVIAARDERDQSSVCRPKTKMDTRVRTVGVFRNPGPLSGNVETAMRKTRKTLQAAGISVVELDMPVLEYVVPAYYTIATAEASANLARYTGVRYGHRAQVSEDQERMVAATRNEGFGDEVKLRILLGTYVLRSGFQDQFYVRAQKIRTAIRNGFVDAFQSVDAILSPVFPTQAFRRGDDALTPFAQKKADQFTASANLAGIPALSFPTGVADGLPVGVQLMGPDFSEYGLFRLLRDVPGLCNVPTPPCYDDAWRIK